MPQQKKKVKKKTGGKKKPAAREAEGEGAVREQRVDWVAVEKQELAHMEEKMAHDPQWLAFSLAKAPWLNFSIDKAIDTALDDSYIGGSDEVVARWMHRAESSVIYWIINKIIERDGRAELFRSLGRGWIFILLRRPQRKFKWWFEGVPRVLRNHQSDIAALNLPEGGLEKYTQGYVCQSEIVFLMKGLTPTRIVPIISIQKMANDFEHLHKWATNDDARRAVQTPFPTDEERQAHAAKAAKRRERNRREKEKKRERQMRVQAEQMEEAAATRNAGGSDRDGINGGNLPGGTPVANAKLELSSAGEESGFAARSGGLLDEGASLSFESLLSQMKMEAMASPSRAPDDGHVPLIDAVSKTFRPQVGAGASTAAAADNHDALVAAETGDGCGGGDSVVGANGSRRSVGGGVGRRDPEEKTDDDDDDDSSADDGDDAEDDSGDYDDDDDSSEDLNS